MLILLKYNNNNNNNNKYSITVQFSIQFNWAFGIVPYGMPSIYGRCFTVVSLPGHCYTLCHSYCWGEPPPPWSTPWGAYGPAISCEAVPLSFSPFGSTHAHSLTVDRSTVDGHIPMDHTCSFMCTSHIDMTVHNLAFLRVR